MKHVYICTGEPQKFKVFCDRTGTYVLDNATKAGVRKYFVGIATARAVEAADNLIAKATEFGSQAGQLH